ncbi:MAG: cobamide remodeling phosphodiesterase CbiR [Synergistaceae bacterium]|nr:cobamide remodeling phosphodiesterase CbiR [Synergistaceae bacterium]
MIKRELELPGLRLGGTSWVIPGSFADNMRSLSPDVSDMEIVLFDTPEHSNMPSKEEVLVMKDLCSELDMSCTVHFPSEIFVSCSEPDRRQREEMCLRTIELFAPLDPFAWILHVLGEKRGRSPSIDADMWLEKSISSAGIVAEAAGDRRKICIETLDYDPMYVKYLAEGAGTSVCLDLGHLVKCGYPVHETASSFADDVRVLHIHGVMPCGTDHRDLSYFDPDLFDSVRGIMSGGKDRVMTIEVFEDDYLRSLEAIKRGLRAEVF